VTFLDALDQVEVLVETPISFRVMESIPLGEYSLSVQASRSHYCAPRATLPLRDYSEYEVAVVDGNGLLSVPHPLFHPRWPWSRYWEGDSVGSYVPTEVVEQLYQHLLKLAAPDYTPLARGLRALLAKREVEWILDQLYI
jgi:hypothetical protein